MAQRLQALGLVAGFITLIAVSGPHLVHHLLDAHGPQEHHSRDPQAQQVADCLVLFLMQYTPFVGSAAYAALGLILIGPQVVLGPLDELPVGFAGLFQARAPPVSPLLDRPFNS